MKLKSIKTAPVKGKRVLVRVDFNVPLKKISGKDVVADDTRIKFALPTLHYLHREGAKTIIVSHLGRPEGQKDQKLSLAPVALYLEKLLGAKVPLTKASVGPEVVAQTKALKPGSFLLLENIRFEPGEITNDPRLAHTLRQLADLYVNEAFAVSHRTHASTVGVARLLPAYAGFQTLIEVTMLQKLTQNPQRPFVAIIGGAKISDKVSAIQNLAKVADVVLVGGGVGNDFLKAEGVNILSSFIEDKVVDVKKQGLSFVKVAQKIVDSVENQKLLLHGYLPLPKIIAPIDVVAAASPDQPASRKIINLTKNLDPKLSKKFMFLDIGPATIKLYQEIIAGAKTIFWNGPVGVFEKPAFATGTKAIAQAIAAANPQAITIIGGGDTVAAIDQFGLNHQYDYVSSAGGAALEFLGGQDLPGLKPLLQ